MFEKKYFFLLQIWTPIVNLVVQQFYTQFTHASRHSACEIA